MTSRRRAPLLCALAFTLAACASEPLPPPEVESTPARGERILFSYTTLDGGTVSTETLAGRYSVIGFVATYDTPSQAQARFVSMVVRKHVPRINAALIVLEPAENRPLVEAFASTLGLAFPVVLADAQTIAGEGPFQGLHHVPSIVILDREGREAWRHLGLSTADDIDAALRALEQDKAPPQQTP
jgi:hypothetical protein